MPAFRIRPVAESDWPEVRALRLEMLRDTPLAFGETLATARRHDEAEWRRRAGRSAAGRSSSFAATDRRGAWIGTMGGYLDAELGAVLVSVYVTPPWRGATGVVDALLDHVEDWAREHGDTLHLHVHALNPRARAAYLRRGFVPTGRLVPYVLDATQSEIEMVKQL